MTGPNLLAWAKKITQWPLVGPRVEKADIDLFDLARAILADEEERKQNPERPLAFGRLPEPPSE